MNMRSSPKIVLDPEEQRREHQPSYPEKVGGSEQRKWKQLDLKQTSRALTGAILLTIFAICISSSKAGPIHEAARSGNIKKVQELLQGSPDSVKERLDDGSTALHEAVRKGHKEIVELLLQNGADPGAETKTGLTPLDLARSLKRVEILSLLGAPPRPKEKELPTATTEKKQGFELLSNELAAWLAVPNNQRSLSAGNGKLFLIANVSLSPEASESHPIKPEEAERIAGAAGISAETLKSRAVAVLAPADFTLEESGGISTRGQYLKILTERVWNELTDYHTSFNGESIVADFDGRNGKLILAVAPGAFPLMVSVAFLISPSDTSPSTEYQIIYRGRKNTIPVIWRRPSRGVADEYSAPSDPDTAPQRSPNRPASPPDSERTPPGGIRKASLPSYQYSIPQGRNELILTCAGQHSFSVGIRSTNGRGHNVDISPRSPAKVSVPDGTYQFYYIRHGEWDHLYRLNRSAEMSGGKSVSIELESPNGNTGATQVDP
jgi:hypothetical protein